MNIPLGKIEEKQLLFSEDQPFLKLKQLLKSGFSGYLVATIEGISGLEEGLVMLRESEIVGAVFDALRIKKQVYGVKGLRLSLNLLKAKKGVFDVNKLSRQQIDLIMAFNDKIGLPKTVNAATLAKLEPAAYRSELVSKELAVDLGAKETKYNLLKKLGLGSI